MWRISVGQSKEMRGFVLKCYLLSIFYHPLSEDVFAFGDQSDFRRFFPFELTNPVYSFWWNLDIWINNSNDFFKFHCLQEKSCNQTNWTLICIMFGANTHTIYLLRILLSRVLNLLIINWWNDTESIILQIIWKCFFLFRCERSLHFK